MNDLIDRLPKLITSISFASIIFFVVHEWSYFTVIGADFLSLFTAYDFISNSLLWIVYLAVGMFLSSLFFFSYTASPSHKK